MNAYIPARIGTVVLGSTLGLLFFGSPAHSQRASDASSLRPKVSVSVADVASADLRLRQSASSWSAASGMQGAGRALASADFDEDGVPDLVTGYASAEGGGKLVLQRGNMDAIYPHTAEALARRQRGEFNAGAFHVASGSVALTEAADFLGAGDFDADGHWDVVAARNGGAKLYWLRGDGRGGFAPPEVIEAHGRITALASGELNRADGLTDLAVGIVAANGAHVLVFESAEGALHRAPESFALAAPVNAFAFGQLDEEAAQDLAIASGSEVIVVQGRDRKLSLDADQQERVPAAQMHRTSFPAEVRSVAIGDFAGDSQQELAALTADGTVRVVSGGNTAQLASSQVRESAAGSTRLLAAKVSALPKDDLLVLGGSGAVEVMTVRAPAASTASGANAASSSEVLSLSATVTSESEVTAVLPMRLNADAFQDLVLLNANGGPATVIESHSPVYVVNTTAFNGSDKNQGDGVCQDNADLCSFYAAVQEANAHPGADTITFNIPGGGVPVVGLDFRQTITGPVTIDGTTQPGGRVEVTASGISGFGSTSVLYLQGGNSVLRGLAIYAGNNEVSDLVSLASSGNVIEGNYLGLRADGSKASFPGDGIGFIGGANNNLIGGTTAASRNIISNCRTVADLSSAPANTFRGNYIGTNPAGTDPLPNARGFVVRDSGLTFGGTAAGAGNLVAATGDTSGTLYLSGTGNVSIQGNRFNTTADGMQPITTGAPIAINVVSNSEITIGGTTAAARNLISGSASGISVQNNTGEKTVIQGNYIGTNAEGSAAIPNSADGIVMAGAFNSVIGGSAAGAGNLISGNGRDGIRLAGGESGTRCRNIIVQGNRIGTDVTGTLKIANAENGLNAAAGAGLLVGGTTVDARNVISGNGQHGIEIGHAGANGGTPSRFQGNFVGLNVFGTGALGNDEHGIFNRQGFPGLEIGGTAAGAGNRIAFNGAAGIASPAGSEPYLAGRILSNSIFSNTGLGLDVGDNGVSPYRNGYGEAPVITSVTSSASETVITGNLRTYTFGPQTSYTIQFFSNTTPDPSGYGEGETLIGETTIAAGQSVAVPFSATITPPVPAGRHVTAVAIGQGDTQNNGAIFTSEFAGNFAAVHRGVLQFSSATYSGNEGANATITVTRTGGSDGAVSVDYTTSNGSANGGSNCSSGADFVNTSGTLTFASGVTEQSFAVAICADDLAEQNEAAGLALTNPTGGAALGTQQTATLSINGSAVPPTPSPTATPTPSPSPSATPAPIAIFVIAPNRGGDAAPAARQITGQGFQAGATVRLTRAGQPDINGAEATVTNNGTTLTATFDLRGKQRGVWSVVVVNPDGGTATLAEAFTIGEARAADLWADISGRFTMRSGFDQQFYISFGNRGDVAAPAAKIVVTFPSRLFDITRRPEFPAGEPAFISDDGETVRMELYLRGVEPGATQHVPFRLRALGFHTDYEFTIDTLTSPEFDALVNRPVDQNTSVSIEPIERTETTERILVRFSTSRGSNEAQYTATRTPATAPREPSLTVRENQGQLNIRYEVTIPASDAGARNRITAPSIARRQGSPFETLVSDHSVNGHQNDDGSLNFEGLDNTVRHKDFHMENLQPASDLREAANKWARDRGLIDPDGFRLLNGEARPGLLPSLYEVLNPPPPGRGSSLTGRLGNGRFLTDYENDLWATHMFWIYEDNRRAFNKELGVFPLRSLDTELSKHDFLIALERSMFDAKSRRRIVKGTTLGSHDPNDKVGPQGIGAAHYITGVEPMSYLIQFENKPEATAAAQEVIITDQLDAARFDFSTFQLGPVTFGERLIAPPPGLRDWTTDVDLRPATNLILRIKAGLDLTSGVATWRFQSIDPATGQPTDDAVAGFLPPNRTSPEGQGSVLFTIAAKEGLIAGTEIRNGARIVFDRNAPIDTAVWLNTIDNSVPVSQVEALPATSGSPRFEVRWSGSDTGAGIASYSIYVSENGGPYTLWLTTAATSAVFEGRPSTDYSFYSVAVDGGGNVETHPLSADTVTTVLSGQLLNISTRLRVQSGENVLIGGIIVTGTEPKRVIIRAIGPSLSQVFEGALANPVLELYQGDTLVAFNDNWRDSQPGEVEATTIPPTHDLESAIVQTLAPGFYTAVMSGHNEGAGIGVIEAYDLDTAANSKLGNIATRGFVDSGDNVMIGGLIVGGNAAADTRVLIRAIGPSLANAGISGALQDPTVELRDSNGEVVRENDNWQESQQEEIEQTTIPPSHPAESAIVATLPPGNYTAVVRGKNDSMGVGLVEVYTVE